MWAVHPSSEALARPGAERKDALWLAVDVEA
jgi:hypothetical protein